MNGFVAGILGVLEAVRFHEGLYPAPCAFVARLTFRWIKGFQPIFIQIEMECFSTICHGISLTHKGIEVGLAEDVKAVDGIGVILEGDERLDVSHDPFRIGEHGEREAL